MKVKLTKDNLLIGDTTHQSGEVVDMPDERALDLVERGHAEWVDVPKHQLSGVDAARAKLGRPA